MSHINIATILRNTRSEKYAIPNFWGGSIEAIMGHVKAAEEKSAPIILCYNYELCPILPVEIGVPLIVRAAEYAKVPIATILDHGANLEIVLKSIYYGISSVMFDGSNLPYEENIRRTKEVVKVAKPLGVSVEAELGAIGGSSIEIGSNTSVESVMTDPLQAEDFVKRTEVDALAVSFGNMHGKYKGTPQIDIKRLKEIAKRISIPLVMHGGSGLTREEYITVIEGGISKINFYTDMALGMVRKIKTKLRDTTTDNTAHHNLIAWGIEFYKRETEKLFDILGCSGKANSIEV